MKFPNPFEPFTIQEAQGNDLGNEGSKKGAKFTKEYAKNVGNKVVGGLNTATNKIMNVIPTSGYMVLFYIIFWWFIFQSFVYFSNNPATTDSFTFFLTLAIFMGVYNVIAYYFYTKEISIRALINTGILSISMGGPVALLLSFSNSFVNVFGNSIGYYFNSVAASEVMNKNFKSRCFENAQIDFGPLVNIFQVNSSNEFYDTVTGNQITDGLKFAFVALISSSTSTLSFLKLRAAAGASDGKTNSDGVIPVFGRFEIDSQALQAGDLVTSIAYAKGASGDSVVIIAGFNK